MMKGNQKKELMPKHWGRYDWMRPDQIDAILEKRPIAYLSWGAIEFHGIHNPTGLDSIKANRLLTDLAEKMGGLVFPTIDLASNLIKSFPGVNFPKYSIEFSEELIKRICIEYFEQLVEQNFKIIVLLSGHAGVPHLDILKNVADEYNNKYFDRYFWVFTEFEIVPDEFLVANHSALGETSLQLFYAPETVNLDALPRDRPISLELDGVFGVDPRNSTKELGKKIVSIFIKNASNKLEELISKYI